MKKRQPTKKPITFTLFEVEEGYKAPHKHWGMDLTNARLQSGQVIEILTIVDMTTKQSPAAEVRTTFTIHDVVKLLDRLTDKGEQHVILYIDHRKEFTSSSLKDWSQRNNVDLAYSHFGKPTSRGGIETFIRRLNVECLNALNLTSIKEAQQSIDVWRAAYNSSRPDAKLRKYRPINIYE